MPNNRRRRIRRRSEAGLTAGLLVASTALAACGSDGASSQDGPIKVMTITAINSQSGAWPNARTAAEASVKAINNDGGVGGRELELVFCDSQGTPTGLAKCGQEAVQEQVVAVVGGFLTSSSALISVLEEAGIAWLGSPGTDNAEYTSKNVFEMGGQLAWQSGAAYLAAKSGCKSIAAFPPDVPGADLAVQMVENGFVAGGGSDDAVTVDKYPPGTADMTPYVARGADADCVVPFMGQAVLPGFLASLNSIGSTQRLVSHQGTLIPATAAQFPQYAEGAVMGGNFDDWQTSAAWAPFREALSAVDAPDMDYGGSYAQLTWAAYMAFKQIAEPIADDIDSAAFLDATSKATSVDADGLMEPLDFTKTWDGLDGEFPRSFNRNAVLFIWKDGKPVREDVGFTDMSGVIEGQPPA